MYFLVSYKIQLWQTSQQVFLKVWYHEIYHCLLILLTNLHRHLNHDGGIFEMGVIVNNRILVLFTKERAIMMWLFM